MYKRGISDPKIWMKGQIWYWNDVIYGSKTSKRMVPEGESGLRYSRMVLIYTADNLIPKRNGDIIVIPLSGHQQYSTDVQINLSDVLRNDSPTYVCVSCIRLIRSQDLTTYICNVSDQQMELINKAVLRTLMNQEVEQNTSALKRPAAENWKNEIMSLITSFCKDRVRPNPKAGTYGCYGTNVWSAWRIWLKNQNKSPDIVTIQDFGPMFIEVRGNLPEEVEASRKFPFSQIPFRFKIEEYQKETAEKDPAVEVRNRPSISNGTQNQTLVKTIPRETVTIGPDEITIDRDDYNSIVARANRGYYVIREKRSIGIMGQMKLEKGDRILCFVPKKAGGKAGSMVFSCEKDIRDVCAYYCDHSLDDTAKKFGIAGSTVVRLFNSCRDWAGVERKYTRVSSVHEKALAKEEKIADQTTEQKDSISMNPIMVTNIDAKINYAAHLISSCMEADDIFHLMERYELNHLVSIPESLFYRKIRTSTYFAIGDLLNLSRDGTIYLSDNREIQSDDPLYKSYLFLETLHTNPMFATKSAIKLKVAKMRSQFGPAFGMNKEFLDNFAAKMRTHMNITEEGVEVLTGIVRDYFCEKQLTA